jgi:DtxR family transcriptional regulator, Mn-dependent transcriptional regulator
MSSGANLLSLEFAVKITISKEDYLKAIAEAEAEGEIVISATLARWLEISAPAVTTSLKRLKRDGLIQVGKDGRIRLTGAGRGIADKVRNRHQLIERMLTEIFKMEWYKVHDEAERLEHAVSEDFEQKLIEVLGEGAACPHGNRVGPDTPENRRKRGWVTLAEVNSTDHFGIVSVFERDRQLLEYLDGLGLRPGVCLCWESSNYDETVTLRVDGRTVHLGGPGARRVWVKQVRRTANCQCDVALLPEPARIAAKRH